MPSSGHASKRLSSRLHSNRWNAAPLRTSAWYVNVAAVAVVIMEGAVSIDVNGEILSSLSVTDTGAALLPALSMQSPLVTTLTPSWVTTMSAGATLMPDCTSPTSVQLNMTMTSESWKPDALADGLIDSISTTGGVESILTPVVMDVETLPAMSMQTPEVN